MWIERISLERFLLFDRLDLSLEKGLNVILAPNEGGKSSLMRGIITALYRDASSRKQEIKESRRWGNDGYFKAGIDLHLHGERYAIERDFEEKKQSIRRDGEQEPYRRSKAVDEFLRENLPLPDENLFLRVCGVHQEELARVSGGKEGIGEQIEEILGGGWGDASPAKVKRIVEEALADIRRGLDRPVNPGNEGPLKRLTEEVEGIRHELAEAKETESRREELLKSSSTAAAKLEELRMEHTILYEKNRRAREYRELSRDGEGVREKAERLRRRKERLVELIQARGELMRRVEEFPRELHDLDDREEVRLLAEVEHERELAGRLEEMGEKDLSPRRRWLDIAAAVLVLAGALGALASNSRFLALSLAGLAVLVYRIVARRGGRENAVRKVLAGELEALRRSREAWSGEMTAADAAGMLMQCIESRSKLKETDIMLGETTRGLQAADGYEEQLGNLDKEYGGAALEWSAIDKKLKELEPYRLDADALMALEKNIEALDGRIQELGVDAQRALQELSMLADSGVQEARERLAMSHEALEREKKKQEILVMIKEALEAARSGLSGLISERLPSAAGRCLELITGGRYSEIRIDASDLSVKTVPADGDIPDGGDAGNIPEEIDPGLLSQGARDQIYFSLRVGLVELLGGAEPLPLFLDDPFVHFDPIRKERAVEIIRTLAEKHQVVLFTCDPGYGKIGGRLITLA